MATSRARALPELTTSTSADVDDGARSRVHRAIERLREEESHHA